MSTRSQRIFFRRRRRPFFPAAQSVPFRMCVNCDYFFGGTEKSINEFFFVNLSRIICLRIEFKFVCVCVVQKIRSVDSSPIANMMATRIFKVHFIASGVAEIFADCE